MNIRTKFNLFLPVFLFLLFSISCSGSSPVDTPSAENINNLDFDSSLLISDRDTNGSPVGGTGLLGVFQAHIDIKTLRGDFTPIRTTASEDVLEVVDITNFLLLAPCFDCINFKSVSMNSDNNLVLEIGIKHPFRAPDLLYPPTAQNRADLHVFNVEGIIILEGDASDTTACQYMEITVGPVVLANADGYSPYLDSVIDPIYPTAANVHPYILHFDNFTKGNFFRANECGFDDIVNPVGNLVMKQGSDWDYKEYEFHLDNLTEPFDFIYAVGCTYGISAESKGVRLTPTYRIPQFNKKAATKVYVSEIIDVPPLGFVGGDALTSETLVIHVLDMNYGVAVGEDLDEMRFASNIVDIKVEIPSVVNGLVTISNPIPTGGSSRNPLDPLTFEITLDNDLAAVEGIYTGLVKVTDSYPVDINVAVDGDGISRVSPNQSPLDGLFDIPEFATYAGFSVDVARANEVPDACFVNNLPSGFDPYKNQTITFDATCSTDIDGSIVLYEWDFEYSAPTFTVDDTGLIVEHAYSTAGDYTIALRVTDDGSPPESDIETQDLTVIVEPPVAFGTNEIVINGVYVDDSIGYFAIPVGSHYADSHGDTIYAVAISDDSPSDVFCVRSDDKGATWITPAGQVNSSAPALMESVSLKLTNSGYADVAWICFDFMGKVYHSRAMSAYNFSTDVLIDEPMLGSMISHSVYGDNIIYTTYLELGPMFNFDVVVTTSTDEGANWSTPVNIAESAGSISNEEEFSVTTETDDNGTLHAVYIDDASGEIRYTQSTDQGTSFSSYVPVATINGYSPLIRLYFSLSIDVSADGDDIYVAYKTEDAGVMQIWCASSINNGGSSFTLKRVDDATTNCDKPCIVLDEYGWVYIVYLDGLNNRDVRVTKSRDKNTTWDASLLVNNDGTGAAQRAPSITVDDELKIHVFFKDNRVVSSTFDLYYSQGWFL